MAVDAPAPPISIVVPTLGNPEGVGRLLETLEAQRGAAGAFEVIVAVDRADPAPAAVDAAIGRRGYPVRTLSPERPGASANRNAGFRAAAAPLVLFLDDDVLASPELVAEHLAWHRRHPAEEVGVLGHVRWARELRVTPFMHWLDHGMQFDFPSIEGTEAGWERLYSANVSFKRTLLERVGGFDEVRLPYLYEDLDLGYRASKLGFRLLYDRRAVVEHLREMDLDLWRRRAVRLAAAEREFTRIHPEIPAYFQRRFSAAMRAPRARGRGRWLIRLLPRRFPLLGRLAWTSADHYYLQALAPDFLAAWESDARDQGSDDASSGGS